MQISTLIEQSERLLSYTKLDFKRFLFDRIKWNNRLIGIKGARGTGKTTLVLQWLKSLSLTPGTAAYFSLDDLYFTQNSLKDTIADFHRHGGQVLALDEVHKYKNWATEIKNCYDFFPDLKIVFTGSSILDITRQEGDLSRRALLYDLPGLSYREYLAIEKIADLPPISLSDLLQNAATLKKNLPLDFRPLQHFDGYLQHGYYPFMADDTDTVHQRINQLLRTIVEYDMAEIGDFDLKNARKVLQLIYIIAQQVPFKPNLTHLAEKNSNS